MASRLICRLRDAKEKQKADSKTDSEARAVEAKTTTKVIAQITNEKLLVGKENFLGHSYRRRNPKAAKSVFIHVRAYAKHVSATTSRSRRLHTSDHCFNRAASTTHSSNLDKK